MVTELYSTSQSTSTRFRLYGILIVVYAIWGSAHFVNKVMVEQMPPLYMAALRYLSAGTLLYFVARLTGTPRPTWQHWKASAKVGVLLLTVANGTLVLALRYLPTSVSALLGGSLPIFILLLNWMSFARERPNRPALVGLLIGLAGVYLLVIPTCTTEVEYKFAAFASVLLLLISNLSWAYGVLLAPRLPLPAQLIACSMQMLVGGSSLLLCSFLAEYTSPATLLATPLTSLWAMGYLIFIGSMVGYTLYVWLARNASPKLIASFGFMGPVMGVTLGVTVANEALQAVTVAGGLLALVGSYLLQRGKESVYAQPSRPAFAKRRATARV
jgi:drug/metabolite transporter (DMT)-like permease